MSLSSLRPKHRTTLMECPAFLSQLHRLLLMVINQGEVKLLKGRPKGKPKGNRQIWKGKPGWIRRWRGCSLGQAVRVYLPWIVSGACWSTWMLQASCSSLP